MDEKRNLTREFPDPLHSAEMIKVAIVEDNRTTREGFETIINLAPGMKCVQTTASVKEALARIPRSAPNVILMDIQLPDGSGIECAGQIKLSLPSVHIIMVTVYEDTDRIFRALRSGACGYLLKRSAPEQIVSAIRDVSQGGAPMTSEIALKVIKEFQKMQPAIAPAEGLSAREREVLESVAQGFRNKEIADRLNLSVESVRWHLKNIYNKLHVHSRTEAAMRFRGQKPV